MRCGEIATLHIAVVCGLAAGTTSSRWVASALADIGRKVCPSRCDTRVDIHKMHFSAAEASPAARQTEGDLGRLTSGLLLPAIRSTRKSWNYQDSRRVLKAPFV